MEEQYVPAITYHQVLSESTPLAEYRGDIPSGQMHRPEFVRQMDYLVEQGFTAVTHDQLYGWLTGQADLPSKPIVIDFDDHSMISYVNALPVMRERGLVATMFVISGLADGDPALGGEMWGPQPPRMRWRELAKMMDAGWEMAAHTYSHLFFTTVPPGVEGDARIMDELVRSKADIQENLGLTPRHFAYPAGLWDERSEAIVKQVFDSARLFPWRGRADYVTRDTDPYRLPTTNINHMFLFEEFKCLVNRSDPDHEYCPRTPRDRARGAR